MQSVGNIRRLRQQWGGFNASTKEGAERRANGTHLSLDPRETKDDASGKMGGFNSDPNEGTRRNRQIWGGFGRSAWRWFRLSSTVVRV